MYDPKSEAREFLGDDAAEATAKACSYFGREASALTVREVTGVSGLGARVIVVAQPVDARMPSRERGPEARGFDEGRGGRERERGGRGERGGRERGGRDRERGGRGGREGRGERGGRFEGRREPRSEREEPAVEAAPEPTEPSVGTPRGPLGETGEYVKGLVERMDLGPFEIERVEQEGVEVFQITGAAASGLTGGDGRTPDAIQLLANQASARLGDDAPRVVIDVEGNYERREQFLFRVAERAAARAKETGRTVALDPMSPRDRRSIHVGLRDAEGVATLSVGEGRYRQVLVVPEGAPEYEEARSSSEGNGS
jgi:predicted RNA-binding protein Jag